MDVPEDDASPVASPTVVCCLPAVGMNAHGAATGDRVAHRLRRRRGGATRAGVAKFARVQDHRDDAIARAACEGRAGGYGHVFAFPDGDAFTLETTGREHRVIDRAGPHTNHYLDPDLAAIAPPASEGSQARYPPQELVAERGPATPEALMDLMRDHDSAPQAICLHPDPAEGDEASAVMFSVVSDVDERMWVSAGNPCESEYVQIDLADLAT